MALILIIDTALENGSVGLSENGNIVASQSSIDQKEHASFLQPAVKQLMMDAGKKLEDIDAVSVSIGPGSYTGLRVGLASAKGFCFALEKPLIAINTLKVISLATIEMAKKQNLNIEKVLFCPLIDARRMEVFTAKYDCLLNTIELPSAKILDESSFLEQLNANQIVFSGTGMHKFRGICHHPNAIFLQPTYGVAQLAQLAKTAYTQEDFADVTYVEPFYVKSFYSTQPKKIIQ